MRAASGGWFSALGFLGEMIQREFGQEAHGIKLEYSFDGEKLLGTGGAIKRASPKLGSRSFSFCTAIHTLPHRICAGRQIVSSQRQAWFNDGSIITRANT